MGSLRRSPGATAPHAAVLRLQSRIGNATVARLLARAPPTADSEEEAPVTATGAVGAQEWGTRAYYHFQARRYEKSLAAWRKAFELYPVPTFLYNEAACLEALKRYDEAADLLERYLTEPSPEPGVAEVKDVPGIQEHIRRLRAGQPGTASASSEPGPEEPVSATGFAGAQEWATRAWDHYQARRFERALAAFENAYDAYPLPGFLYNEAACLEQLGRVIEAADTYERYLKVPDPPDAGARQERDPEHVLERIHRLRVRADAQAPDPIETTGRVAAQAWFDRGQLAYLGEDWGKALESFQKALAAEPLAAFVYNEGATLEKLDRPAAAANAYERYLVLDPAAKDHAEVIEHIKSLRETGGKDKLIDPWAGDYAADYTAGVTGTGVEAARQWLERGTIAYELAEYRRAYDCFVSAYDNKPLPEFVYNQAAALELSGETDAAIQTYERYLALLPKPGSTGSVGRFRPGWKEE
jgi:tetratricopeptide (TPR) repeat protein